MKMDKNRGIWVNARSYHACNKATGMSTCNTCNPPFKTKSQQVNTNLNRARENMRCHWQIRNEIAKIAAAPELFIICKLTIVFCPNQSRKAKYFLSRMKMHESRPQASARLPTLVEWNPAVHSVQLPPIALTQSPVTSNRDISMCNL